MKPIRAARSATGSAPTPAPASTPVSHKPPTADSRQSLAARAARTYLDVCFFHPFDDGNARAALLALLFVLARAGVTLDSVVLIGRVGHRADDQQDALGLCRSVELQLRQNRTTAR
ncbi:Fic family protein [Kitasatospora sp. NPDC057015]|uniref:Fic family protein n=1 Tax=Kitasatospora sp. NPDC057015 TaxID=3346001 RepID=UPI00363B18AD